MENVLTNSKISKNARLFKNICCIDSEVSAGCTVADDCVAFWLIMHEKSELGRRSLVRNAKIGRGSYTGENAYIKNADIGKYCSIAWNVSIGGGPHDYTHVSMYTDYWINRTFGVAVEPDPPVPRVTIGNDVWIGCGANILSGVTIGDGAAIGAGAVVVKDVLPYSIVAGVPAKVIKMRFDDEAVALLQELRWWDWDEEKIVANLNLIRNAPDKENLRSLLRKVDVE